MPVSKYSTNLEGQRFGRWTIISFAYKRPEGKKSNAYYWLCRCDCGSEKKVNTRLLFRGKSTSCGCYYREQQLKVEHGYNRSKTMGHQPEYRSWSHAIQRVDNPNHNKAWHRYGGRGITACEGFRHFPTFIATIGNKPESKRSIDRIDNNGHYSCGQCFQCSENGWPMNVRWATRKEQAANTCRSAKYR